MASEQFEEKKWKPGQSGNPSGRPKKARELVDAFREFTSEALQTLVEVMRSGKRDNDRVRAAEVVLERGWGKCVEIPVDDSGNEWVTVFRMRRDDTPANKTANTEAECTLSSSTTEPPKP